MNNNTAFHFKDVTEFLHQFETKYDLYQYSIDGWSAWATVRSHVANSFATMSFKEPISPFHNARIKRYVFAIKDLPKLVWPPKARYVFRAHTSALRELEAGYYKDIFLDDLLRCMKSTDYFKLEDINSEDFFKKRSQALIKSDASTLSFGLISSLLAKFGRPRSVSRIAAAMSAIFIKIPELRSLTQAKIGNIFLSFYWHKKLFGWLFDRTQPEYLMMPTNGHYPMVAAAKERGIKVIEFQHGSPNGQKVNYSWPKEAKPFKPELPIPDLIFLYGEYFQQELMKHGFWDVELIPIGSIRMEQYREIRSTYKLSKNYEICNLLVTTQGIQTEALVDFLCEFIEIAKNRIKIKLVIKLQPNSENDKTPYTRLLEAGDHVDVLLGTEFPSTFELMSQTDFHMSIFSTTHFEALGFGIPTVILPFLNHEIMLPLYESGHAFFAKTPLDLLNIILNNANFKIPESVKNYYLKPCALENIKKQLRL